MQELLVVIPRNKTKVVLQLTKIVATRISQVRVEMPVPEEMLVQAVTQGTLELAVLPLLEQMKIVSVNKYCQIMLF